MTEKLINPYYDGTKWRLIAFYPKLADRKTEFSRSRKAALERAHLHRKAGANVEIAECMWVERITPLYWFDADKQVQS